MQEGDRVLQGSQNSLESWESASYPARSVGTSLRRPLSCLLLCFPTPLLFLEFSKDVPPDENEELFFFFFSFL